MVGWLLLRRHTPVPVIETKEFRPFQELDAGTAWPRSADVRRVLAALSAKRDLLPVVVGPSGAGKTTLLTVLVPAALRSQQRYEIISTYQGLQRVLARRVSNARESGEPVVIVLDQFEQWLAAVRAERPDKRAQDQGWLRHLLRASQLTQDYTVVLSVRAEWFYDLRFLGDLLPPLSLVVNVDGAPAAEQDNELRESILTAFERVVNDAEIAEGLVERIGRTGHLSPLEAQLVGAAVEEDRAKPRGKTLSLASFDAAGGAAAAAERYLDQVLAGSEDPEVCLKVLCAFSIQTRFRQQLDRALLEQVLFEDSAVVDEAVSYLERHGLVIERSTGLLDLAHDYLAEFFWVKSGEELHPVERDNIFVHTQMVRSGEGAYESKQAAGRPVSVGRIAGAVLALVMTVRLMNFGLHWAVVGPSFTATVFGSFLDASYIPIYVAQGAWLVYALLMYDDIFRNLEESRLGRAASLLTLINACLGALLGILWPTLWLVGIGWGGLGIAVKLLSVAGWPSLNKSARHLVLMWGLVVIFLSVSLGMLGAADWYIASYAIDPTVDANRWLAINSAVAAFIAVAAWLTAPVQVSRSGVSQLKGLMARPSGAKALARQVAYGPDRLAEASLDRSAFGEARE